MHDRRYIYDRPGLGTDSGSFCDSDVADQLCIKLFSQLTSLVDQVNRGAAEAKVDNSHVERATSLTTRFEVIAQSRDTMKQANILLAGPNALACQIIDAATALQADAAKLSNEVARLMGEAGGVVDEPDSPAWPWWKWGLLFGGGLMAFAIYMKGRSGGPMIVMPSLGALAKSNPSCRRRRKR
jgi:hypothetical protein